MEVQLYRGPAFANAAVPPLPMHGAFAQVSLLPQQLRYMACCCRPMHAQRRACMQAAYIASLLLALGACSGAAEPAQLHDDRQLLQTQQAARHLLQGAAQAGPAQIAGPGGGAAGAVAGAGSPAARAVPSASPVAAAAAGAASSPGLSPDGTPLSPSHHLRAVCMHWLPNSLTLAVVSVYCTYMELLWHRSWVVRDAVRAAASALQFFQQGIANWRDLKSWGFKGWDFTSSPCQGWSGVSCDAAGRVSKL